MDDRCIMENILLTEKGACDLYMHGTIESGTMNVNQTFDNALQDTLALQNSIYKEMSQRGWYQETQAEQQQITNVKNKFASKSGNQGLMN